MRIQLDKALLLIIDVQGRLVPALDRAEAFVDGVTWLGRLAQAVQLPVVITEHCADKIGGTDPAVLEAAPGAEIVHKRSFSAVRDGLLRHPDLAAKEHIIVSGCEAHVCVLQTCLDLVAAGKTVYLVQEAIASRHQVNLDLGIERLRQAGVIVVSGEMVAFELLATADHPKFSTVLKQLIK